MSTWRALPRRRLRLVGGPGSATPMSTEAHGRAGLPGRAVLDRSHPAMVITRNAGGSTSPASTAAWARQRIPLPLISATLPSALRSSMVRSASPATGQDPDRPRRPDAALPVAQGPHRSAPTGPAGRRGRAHQEVVTRPWCLVRRSGRVVASVGSSSRPSLPPAPGPGRRPTQRQHHNQPGRSPGPATRYGDRAGTTPTVGGRRPGSAAWPRRPPRPGDARPRDGPAARGSRGPGGRSATARRAGGQGADLVEEPGSISRREALRDAPVEPVGVEGGSRPGRPMSADSASRPGPNDENGRPEPRVTSRARTSRRRLVGSIRAAAGGSSSASRRGAWRGGRRPRSPGAAGLELASRAAATSGIPAREAADRRPPTGGTARSHPTSRARVPRAAMSASAPRRRPGTAGR